MSVNILVYIYLREFCNQINSTSRNTDSKSQYINAGNILLSPYIHAIYDSRDRQLATLFQLAAIKHVDFDIKINHISWICL